MVTEKILIRAQSSLFRFFRHLITPHFIPFQRDFKHIWSEPWPQELRKAARGSRRTKKRRVHVYEHEPERMKLTGKEVPRYLTLSNLKKHAKPTKFP
jgi:hypothetical protein